MSMQYMPVFLNKPFILKATGRLRSINCNPRETVIFRLSHTAELVLDFSAIDGFPAHLLPRLDILLLEGALCTLEANEPSPWAIEPPRALQAILELETVKLV